MRWATLTRVNIALVALALLIVAAWVLAPSIGLAVPGWVFLVGVLTVFAVNTAFTLWTFRAMRADAARVVAAHPGVVAVPSVVTSWPQLEKADRQRIVVLVADRRGLSFRDHEDREVQLVPAEQIISLELAPLEPRARFRPFRLTTIDGGTIDFSGPVKPDDQVDAVVALRTALGRRPDA